MTRRRDIHINGGRVRQLRSEQGKTLYDVATATGLSTSFLSDLERGNRQTTTLATTVRLAAALGVPTQEVAA